MPTFSTFLSYPIAIILSIGRKSFTNIGKAIQKSGESVSLLLQPEKTSYAILKNICLAAFKDSKKLYIIIDDTLIKKYFSEWIQGTAFHYDSKMRQRITALRIVIGMISDGKMTIPIYGEYLFDIELLKVMNEKHQSKIDMVKALVKYALAMFPGKKMILVADGLYADAKTLRWCKDEKISAEMRMHSNRVVQYKDKRMSLKELAFKEGVIPKGRQMARTITVIWHEMELEITVVRRIDKHDEESIVFQVATYKALPREHVTTYSCRWPVEKSIRTEKQRLGLQDCYSTSFEKQRNHVAAVFVSYALAQLEMKYGKLKNAEDAIRRLEVKNRAFLEKRFARFLQSESIAQA